VELRKLDMQVGVTIAQDLDPALPALSADPNQMLQVCFDLVGNAVDALNGIGGGKLTIRTWRQNGAVYLEFKDTGPGVQNPEKIFDPFYTTKPVGQGAGLGLSAAYGIVREHGGLISCENDATGASFQIMLPHSSDSAPRKTASAVAGH
jgi:two-component system NtrC family sensor kinase